MISASFLGVGNEGYYVSDLVVSGYEENYEMLENMEELTLDFYILNEGGQTLKQKNTYFCYIDTPNDDCDAWLGGVWFDYQGKPIECIGAENDYVLKPGDAIWLSIQGITEGFTYSITTKGGVLSNSYVYELRDGGNGIGNPKANPVWVSEIAVTGYEENYEMLEGMEELTLDFYILNEGGQTLKQKNTYFCYIDTPNDDCDAWLGGVWFDYQGNPIEEHGDNNDYQLGLGQGIWLSIQGITDGFTYYIVFP